MKIIDPENMVSAQNKKDIEQLTEDIACLCDGLDANLILDVLTNMAVKTIIFYKVDIDEYVALVKCMHKEYRRYFEKSVADK